MMMRVTRGSKTSLSTCGLSVLVAFLLASGPVVYGGDAGDAALALLQDNTDGTVGIYLKQVGGPVLESANQSFVFEPASTIKVLHHLHAMLQVEAGNIALIDSIPTFTGAADPGATPPCPSDCPNPCPVDVNPFNIVLQTALQQMMGPSHNTRTQAVRVFFGEANINATAQTLGMADSLIQHRIGCGVNAVANHNQLTLVDAGRLYEAVAANNILPNNRNNFYNLMNQGRFFDPIINAEAALIGLTTDEVNDFKSKVAIVQKGGSYGLSDGQYRTLAGWVRFPFDCEGVTREYVFGNFVHAASDLDTQNTGNNISVFAVGSELLRDVIIDALTSTFCNRPPDITTLASDLTVECDGAGNIAAVNAWLNGNGGATASDDCGDISWTNDYNGLSDGCGATGSVTVTFTATSNDGCDSSTAETTATFTIEDTVAAEIACNAPATIVPNDAPIHFTATGLDDCCGDDATVTILSFRCFMINGAGKEIDKGQSCIVEVDGDMIWIDDSGGTGGQGTFVEWTVSAVDCCGNPSEKVCSVEVVRPTPNNP